MSRKSSHGPAAVASGVLQQRAELVFTWLHSWADGSPPDYRIRRGARFERAIALATEDALVGAGVGRALGHERGRRRGHDRPAGTATQRAPDAELDEPFVAKEP